MQYSGAVFKYCVIFYHNFVSKGPYQKLGLFVTYKLQNLSKNGKM